MGTSPVFNEVIGVSFDTQSFTESVQALKDIWQKALEDMSGKSPVVGVTNLDAVTSALTKIVDGIKSVEVSYTESLGQISGKLVETVTSQAEKVEGATKTVSAAAKKAAIDVVNEFAEMANQSEEALERFHDAASTFLGRGNNVPSALTTNAQSKLFQALQSPEGVGGENAIGIGFDDLSAKQKQWYTNFAQTMAQAEDRLREFGRAGVAEEQETQLNAALAAFGRYQQELVTLEQEANAEMMADFRANMAQRVEANAVSEAEIEALNEQELAVYVQLLDAKIAADEKANNERIALAQKEEDAEEEANRKGLAAFRTYINEKIAAEAEDTEVIARFTAEQSEIYQQAAMKYAAIWKAAHAENAKRDGSNNETQDDAAMQRQLQQQVAMQQRANAEMLADFRKMISAKIAAGQLDLSAVEKLSAQETAVYDQEARKFAATWEQAYAEKARRAAAANKKNPEEPSGFIQSFGSAFKENLSSESLGNLAGLQVAWIGIGAAIGAASKATEEVVGLFKSGFEYLSELEQKASLLQGVIASNVKLSQDFEENFKLAGEASVQLQRNFEDASIKYGISVEVLERGFKQLVDGGGVSLVHNLQEAQEVAVLFGVSLQAAGKDADTTRAILSELPKMLTDTEKPSSLILETLGLTAKQWDAMVKQAKEHHDLLAQLSPLMQNYTKVAEESANRQIPLMESISLQVKRIMADAEKNAFASWTGVLQSVKQFLDENKDSLETIVKSALDAVVAFTKMLEAVIQLGNTIVPLSGSMHELFQFILLVANGVTTVANYLETVINIVNRLSSVKVGQNFKQDWKEATDYAKEQIKGFHDDLEKRASDYYKQQFLGQKPDHPQDPSVLLPPGAGSKVPTDLSKEKTDNSALNELKKEYANAEALSKQQYDVDVDRNNLLLAERKKSIDETDAANAAAASAEYLRQMHLIDVYREKANAMKGVKGPNGTVKDSAITGFNETLDTKSTTFGTQEMQRVSALNIKTIKDGLAAQDAADTESIASVRKMTDAKIAEFKRAEQAGTLSTRTMLALEEVYYRAAKNTIDQFYDSEIVRAGADAARVKQLTAEKAQADAKYTSDLNQNSNQRIANLVKEFDAQQNASLRKVKTETDSVVDNATTVRRANNPLTGAQASQVAAVAQEKYAEAVVKARAAELAYARSVGETSEALQRKDNALQEAQDALNKAHSRTQQADQAVVDKSPEGAAVKNVADSLKAPFDDFAGTTQNFAEAINVFHGSVNNIVSALQKGGVLGGIGASAQAAGGMATSLAKSVGSALGPIFAAGGPILSAVGSIFSVVSSIFEQEAQDIANTIEKNLTNANNAYQNQTATLVQTLQAVQQQRQQAIDQLSGVKGGQDQLDKLLPQIDQEIAQLKLQIKEAMVTFTNSLQDLSLNNSALSAAFDKWQQINSQVQAYLSAGGSVAAANKYISESLEAMKMAAGDALNQGYQTAIADAENLNNLIQQRMQLERQEAESEFNTVNGDALERRGTKAIDVGTQLQQQKAQYEQQKENLDSQISLTQQKVSLEGQIFDIAMSTAQLQQTSNALQIEQLNEQLDILKAQKDIYNGITQGANGQYTASTTLMNEIGVVNIIVQAGGTAGDDSAANPKDIADAVSGVMHDWARYGIGSSIGKT